MKHGTGISLILSLFFAFITDQRKVTVLFERVETVSNDQYVKNVNVSLSKSGGLNVDVHNLQVVQEVYAQMQVTLLQYIAGHDMIVMNRTVNYCHLGRNKNPDREQLWAAIMDIAVKSGNFSLGCPLYPGSYFLHNLTMTDYELPNFIPDARFRLLFSLLTENEIGDLVRVLKFSILGRVKASKRDKGFNMM
ncbi:unnamed protein product [Hermetia illucens]|uniref:Uncharacterized protein n=1 Tax=Hermetia illucens TaxID=343691 RepID=A0A7R8UKH4_HERIL|nr:unnamed protein product [Hermetia illucens]